MSDKEAAGPTSPAFLFLRQVVSERWLVISETASLTTCHYSL